MSAITTVDVRRYMKQRQETGASNGAINRELTDLKRMFMLAAQAGKLMFRPHIPLLKENNTRKGCLSASSSMRSRRNFPVHMRRIAGFAYVTGWRTPSGILPLEWRQVDLKAGEVRLDPGTTKNDDGRVRPGLTPHDFRRTAVRNLERKGASRSVAMKLTGHKREAVYRRYAIVGSEDLRDAVWRLESADRYTSSYTQPSSKASKRVAQKS